MLLVSTHSMTMQRFKNGYKRVSGGLEYVVGFNEFHANIIYEKF